MSSRTTEHRRQHLNGKAAGGGAPRDGGDMSPDMAAFLASMRAMVFVAMVVFLMWAFWPRHELPELKEAEQGAMQAKRELDSTRAAVWRALDSMETAGALRQKARKPRVVKD